RGQCILRGFSAQGGLAETWAWDGTNWTNLLPASGTPNIQAAMAYDPLLQRVVLFGRSLANAPETWEWDGTTWLQRQPAASPPVRAGHAMTFDEVRGRVVVFGGVTPPNVFLNDTWEWDGTTWQRVATPSSPAPRSNHSMVHTLGKTVLFGGSGQ